MRGSAALGYLFRYVFGNQSYYDLLKRKLFEQIDVSLQANRRFSTRKTFYPHPSLQTQESPCGKGFEGSVGCFQPYTDPTLTLHSESIDKGLCFFTGCIKNKI